MKLLLHSHPPLSKFDKIKKYSPMFRHREWGVLKSVDETSNTLLSQGLIENGSIGWAHLEPYCLSP